MANYSLSFLWFLWEKKLLVFELVLDCQVRSWQSRVLRHDILHYTSVGLPVFFIFFLMVVPEELIWSENGKFELVDRNRFWIKWIAADKKVVWQTFDNSRARRYEVAFKFVDFRPDWAASYKRSSLKFDERASVCGTTLYVKYKRVELWIIFTLLLTFNNGLLNPLFIWRRISIKEEALRRCGKLTEAWNLFDIRFGYDRRELANTVHHRIKDSAVVGNDCSNPMAIVISLPIWTQILFVAHFWSRSIDPESATSSPYRDSTKECHDPFIDNSTPSPSRFTLLHAQHY